MSKYINDHSKLFGISIISSIISSLSLIGAVMVNPDGKNKVPLMILALTFWIFLIVEQVSFWKADSLMKKDSKDDKHINEGKIGLLSIGVCKEGLIVDILFVVLLIGFAISLIVDFNIKILQYLTISLIVLLFRMHCFLNGRNYKYKKTLNRKGV